MTQEQKPVALVTGANKGIGLAVTQELASRGYIVYLGSRDEQRGTQGKAAIERAGLDIRVIQMEVADDASIAAAADRLQNETGRLDVLVNNAGISGARLSQARV